MSTKSKKTAKTDEKKTDEKKPVLVAVANNADMDSLKAVCEAIVSRDKGSKLSESEMLVASAAMNLDRWGEFVGKDVMMKDVNERTSFGAYYYRDPAEERHGQFNLWRGVHRDVSAHYGCKLGRGTNVLEAEVMETAFNAHNNKASKRSQRLRISKAAQKVLSEYAEAIASKFAR